MNKEEKILLNSLLDIYERSKSYKENTQTANRITLTMHGEGRNKFKQYNIEDNEARACYNDVCRSLKERGFIDYDWCKGSYEHILSKVWLMTNMLKDTYSAIGRMPKSKFVDDVLTLIREALKNTNVEWAISCLIEWKNNITVKRSVGSFLPQELDDIKCFLKVLISAANIKNEEVLERAFSVRTLGDSKKFENEYRNRLISVLKKYLAIDFDSEDISNSDVLALIGIVRYPEQITFCGNLLLIINIEKTVDFSIFKTGACINSNDIRMFDISIGKNVSNIITIENKANFYDYILNYRSENELVIYHGGCYSPSKNIFFQKLMKDTNADVALYHWSDIDYGGFSMLKRLRIEINPSFKAMRMDKKDLVKYSEFTTKFGDGYAQKLHKLIQSNELADCRECIEYMLETRQRLEQEIMI